MHHFTRRLYATSAALCAALLACACSGRAGPSARDAADEQRLLESVARLRAERRQTERRIRELEGRLAETSSTSPEPALPVQILAPDAAAAPVEPEQALEPGERVVGVADDGSEIVYADDAATGRLVQPSAEALAAMGRSSRQSPRRAPPPPRDEAPEGALVDGAGHDRIEALDDAEELSPPPLTKLGRRASRARPPRHAATPALPPRPTERQAAPTRGDGAEEHYRAAMALVRAASYEPAIASLREFLQRFPRHDYADNAQYWLGEAFYAQRQYPTALAELRKVGELYPGGNKVPDALLKVGYCLLAMGDRETSAATLRELLRLYPRSAPAALAQKKLEEASL